MSATQRLETSSLRLARSSSLGVAVISRGALRITFSVCAPVRVHREDDAVGKSGLETDEIAKWQVADPDLPDERPRKGDLVQPPRGGLRRVEDVADHGCSWVLSTGVA